MMFVLKNRSMWILTLLLVIILFVWYFFLFSDDAAASQPMPESIGEEIRTVASGRLIFLAPEGAIAKDSPLYTLLCEYGADDDLLKRYVELRGKYRALLELNATVECELRNQQTLVKNLERDWAVAKLDSQAALYAFQTAETAFETGVTLFEGIQRLYRVDAIHLHMLKNEELNVIERDYKSRNARIIYIEKALRAAQIRENLLTARANYKTLVQREKRSQILRARSCQTLEYFLSRFDPQPEGIHVFYYAPSDGTFTHQSRAGQFVFKGALIGNIGTTPLMH